MRTRKPLVAYVAAIGLGLVGAVVRGDCPPLFPGAQYTTADRPSSVAIGDLNGDQVPDLAVANGGVFPDPGDVSVLLGLGDGTFSGAVHYVADESPISVAIGDLDGDRVPDLAVANARSNNVSVLLGLGDGAFADAVQYAAGDGPRSVAIDDLNGDQVPDLAVANSQSDDVSILLGVGDGTFADAVNYAVGIGPVYVAIGDLDRDHVLDLAVVNYGLFPKPDGDVSVLLGVGDGTFADAMHYAAGDRPTSVAIGDLDGDQVLDLAVSNSESDTVSILAGVGDGTFADAVHYATGDRPSSVAIGNLDGDQVLDLAVANQGANPEPGSVSVLTGRGDGTFAAAAHYGAGFGPGSVAIGDLDGDQLPDLATANLWSDDVSVLLNQCATLGGCVRAPEWICDGDVDGDGQVNPVDSGLVQAAFGSLDGQDLCNYDVDCDGQINPVDSGIVQSLFGTCEAPRSVCP